MRIAMGMGFVAALLAAVPAQAAMPIHIQRQGALNEIIELPAIREFAPIDRIERIAEHVWRVTAGRCYIDVTFVERQGYYPLRGLGPPQMEPHPGRPVCQR